MPTTIRCPACGAQARVADPLPEGKRARCPSCGEVLPRPRAEPEQPSPAPARRATRPAEEDEDEREERERPRRRRARPKNAGLKVVLLGLGGCGLLALLSCVGVVVGVYYWVAAPTSFPEQTEDYAEARAKFQTKLVRRGPAPQEGEEEPAPAGVRPVEYNSAGLRLKAWVSGPPPAGGRHPAVLFLHGGFAFGEDDWEATQPFRDAGFVVMTPILRGENGQPGAYTMFYDEVNDVLAAAEALARLPYVDANRLYVAGHSAGGTLALLAALTSNRFRAAASFSGSPDQVSFARGQKELVPFNPADQKEYQMRSPLAFARSFKCPTRLYYGDEEWAFKASSRKTAEKARAAGLDVEAVSVPGDHFDSVPEAMRRAITFFRQK
jgi:dienelactone hydrolase